MEKVFFALLLIAGLLWSCEVEGHAYTEPYGIEIVTMDVL